MRNQNSHLNFLFFSTLMAILIWMASPSVKSYVNNVNDINSNNDIVNFPLAEYQAQYSVNWHGLYGGDSLHTLRRRADNQYHYETRTLPKLKFLPFQYVESSDFSWENGKILPQNYYYNIQEGSRHKKGNVSFDWKENKLRNLEIATPWEAEISAGIQDKLTQTLSLRQALKTRQSDLKFAVAEEDKIKNYDFIILGEERITTHLGPLDTVKISHRSRKGHLTTTWLAKKWDYLPVKMIQTRQGKQVASGDIINYQRL